MSSLLASIWPKSPGQPVELQDDVDSTERLLPDTPTGEAKCELRIEGMTCGACVEVSELSCAIFAATDRRVVDRGNASTATWNTVSQGGPAC